MKLSNCAQTHLNIVFLFNSFTFPMHYMHAWIDCRSGQDRQEYARVKNDGIELGGMDWWKNIYDGKNMKIKLE